MFPLHRRGRPRKIGQRFPSGNLNLSERPFPGKSAIYVIELTDGIIKIGRSQNPQERIKSMLVGYEQPPALICCFWMADADAVKIELKIHRKLQATNAHARGEMYYLDAEAAIATIKAIIGKRPVELVGLEQLQPESKANRAHSGRLHHRDVRGSIGKRGPFPKPTT
jgi:hypothetical protein